MRTGRPRESLSERFWSKVQKGDGCWEWTGARHSFGYGWINRPGRGNGKMMAHRLSWELHFGPVAGGRGVLHHCDNPCCVRPDHLFLGSQSDNVRDMWRKGRARVPRALEHPRAIAITWRDRTQTITDWASELGIDIRTLANRLKRGWSIDMALGTPVGRKGHARVAASG